MSSQVDFKQIENGTVPGCLAESAKRDPERLAIVDNSRRITYGELWAEVKALATGLQRLGVVKGDRVCVCLPNWHEFVVAYFAIGLAGGAMIPLNTRYKPREVEYIIKNSGASTVISAYNMGDYKLMEMYLQVKAAVQFANLIVVRPKEDLPKGVKSFDEVIRTGREMPLPVPEINPEEDLAAILYTSGTTGEPKGAMLTHRNLVKTGVMQAGFLETSPQDNFLVMVPVFHIFGMSPSILTAILSGAGIVFMEAFKPDEAMDLIQKEKITVHHGVPTMFIMELNHPDFAKYDLSSLRTGIIAAAPCPVEVVKAIRAQMGCNIVVSYGMTETSPSLTATLLNDDAIDIAETVGRACPGVELKICDDEGQPVGVNQVGEIVARSPGVMKGYWGKPKETAEVLSSDGWLKTGDLGTMDERGFVKIVGRKKEMLIRGGYNIYPRELEEVFYTHPAVLEAAVVGIPDAVMGERTCACIKLKPGASATPEELQAYCKQHLANYKIPDWVIFVDEFPTTASGKIRKIDLRDIMIERFSSQAAEK